MNEKNLTEIDSDKENANPITENTEDNIVEEEAPANVAEDTLENAETSCEEADSNEILSTISLFASNTDSTSLLILLKES